MSLPEGYEDVPFEGEALSTVDSRRILWEPSPEHLRNSNVAAFMQEVTRRYGIECSHYEEFYQWSVTCSEDFWRAWFDWCGLKYDGDPTCVLTYAPHPGPLPSGEGTRRMIDARWFPHVRLNFSENLLRFAEEQPGKEAIAFFSEDGRERHLTFGELKQEAVRFSQVLDAYGVQQGDRVAAFMPNIPESISAMLATTARGALWSSVSPEFGVDAVVDRFGQLEPKVLITTDGHTYRGKIHDALPKVQEIIRRIPSIEHTVVVPYISRTPPDVTSIPDATVYNTSLSLEETGQNNASLMYERLPFNHPVYILFSSGTTGKPKCIVHGAGGTLLHHSREHCTHTDLKEGDTMFYFSTTNWMVWNLLVSALGVGSKIVIYDGDPLARDGRILFDIAQKERITVFGASAKFFSAIEKNGLRPRETHDLSSLRTILSTGSTLYGSQFDYVYAHVHDSARLCSVSGGTDIIGAFAAGSPLKPVRREEIQTRALGYAVDVFDDEGSSVPRGVRGELVCTAPFPSQPVRFWNDPGDERYLKAYFEKYGPGIWHHGDYAELTQSGGMVIHGRSDATLNPGGVRIGTAEIYIQVEKVPEVLEAIAIGQHRGHDERIVLFVVLQEGRELTEELTTRIRFHIRSGTSPRHVPAVILAVPALPRTRNGKLSELSVKAAVHGEEVTNTDALANPEVLEYFRDRPELSM